MLNSISALFYGKDNPGLPARQMSECIAYAQDDIFFHLSIKKNDRVVALKQHFANNWRGKILLSDSLGCCDAQVPGATIELLPNGFFKAETQSIAEKKALLDDAIVITLNNDDSLPANRPHFADLYGQCDKTIFVVWDWDNHHWLDYSTFLAAHSDLYVPAHHENLYLLSRYNHLISGPVYATTFQWTRKFLADSLPEIIAAPRSNDPLGMHIPYATFPLRMRTVVTLNSHYPSIGFAERSFFDRSPQERLGDWMAHKSHWIIPVLNDVPIRIFDALASGGIPIVPESMRFLSPVSAIDRKHIAFYGAKDIVAPQALVARVNEMFDEGGRDGLVARHRYALDHHHCNAGISRLLAYAAEAFELAPRLG